MINRLLLFILIIIPSCVTIPKSTYDHKGFSFKLTEEFGITETTTYSHNHATFIRIEYRKSDHDADFSVTWLPKKYDLDKELQGFVESLKESYEKDEDKKTPVFSEVRSTKFGSNEARQIDYVIANSEQEIGSYTSFHCDSLTVIIGQHCTRESEVVANRCRKMIEETYACVGQTSKK